MAKLGRLGSQTHVQIDGVEALKDMLLDFSPNEVRNILRNTVNGVAGQVRDELKRRVKKRSGALADSIKVVRRKGKPNFPVSDVRGGATAPYMLMLEFGTSKTKRQPFIVPTVESMRPGMTAIYREQFGKKLEQALARRAKKAAK